MLSLGAYAENLGQLSAVRTFPAFLGAPIQSVSIICMGQPTVGGFNTITSRVPSPDLELYPKP